MTILQNARWTPKQEPVKSQKPNLTSHDMSHSADAKRAEQLCAVCDGERIIKSYVEYLLKGAITPLISIAHVVPKWGENGRH